MYNENNTYFVFCDLINSGWRVLFSISSLTVARSVALGLDNSLRNIICGKMLGCQKYQSFYNPPAKVRISSEFYT